MKSLIRQLIVINRKYKLAFGIRGGRIYMQNNYVVS